jgi:hypothetical protein
MSAGAASPSSAAVLISLSHRTRYTSDEEISFRHVRAYLGGYDLYAIVPESHDATYPGLRMARFPDRYFGSAAAHGELLLSPFFYRAFERYEYVLVYHLDSLVFADRLKDWCAAGYDYIGAPWLISPDTPHITTPKVGNGGFSLRRVSSFLRVLSSRRYFIEPEAYWRGYAARADAVTRAFNFPRKYLKRLRTFNDVHWHIRWALRGGVHEDRFWAEYATHYDPSFRIAPVDVAMRFAWEAEPRRCYERIGRELPFGVHRWSMFDRAFFEPFLLTSGHGSLVRPQRGDMGSATLPASFTRIGARTETL